MDILGRVCEIIVTVILLFFIPLAYTGAKHDMMIQTYVTTETSFFAEAIRNSGSLTKNMYDLFLKKLNETGHVYEIELTHYEEKIDFDLQNDSNQNELVQFSNHYYGIYTQDIIKDLYETTQYTMKQGDYFMVKVQNKDKTYGTKLQEWFLQRALPNVQIFAVYGGIIRNEAY